MDLIVQVDPRELTRDGYPVIHVCRNDGERLCQLDIEFSELARLPRPPEQALDLLLVAATVYALDKLVPRKGADDYWTRDISISVPVSDRDLWQGVRDDLERCLSFLSGDRWTVHFERLGTRLARRRHRVRRRHLLPVRGDIVSLFSGGLDSLVGAIDCLESMRDSRVVLVGHHDGQIAGPLSDQKGLLEQLRPRYPHRIGSALVRVGHTGPGLEITLRSRSFLFIALGIYAAASMGPVVPLLMPENGTIAVNVPLTPARRGSCSTRTAHPFYLEILQQVLGRVGLRNPIANPLALKTKGEAVAQCRNLELIRELAPLSVSCAKRGHNRTWTRRSASGCGRCMPCVYRRAALHKIGIDVEPYGDDFCAGEVNMNERTESGPNDLRACFSFLRTNPTKEVIERALLSNGSLDLERLPEYGNLVRRAMDEIRALIRDKAIPRVQRQAGL